jgi:hypothetical protein
MSSHYPSPRYPAGLVWDECFEMLRIVCSGASTVDLQHRQPRTYSRVAIGIVQGSSEGAGKGVVYHNGCAAFARCRSFVE